MIITDFPFLALTIATPLATYLDIALGMWRTAGEVEKYNVKWYNNFSFNSSRGSKKNKNESEIVSETSVIGCMAQVKTKLFIIDLAAYATIKLGNFFHTFL